MFGSHHTTTVFKIQQGQLLKDFSFCTKFSFFDLSRKIPNLEMSPQFGKFRKFRTISKLIERFSWGEEVETGGHKHLALSASSVQGG
jgi:hypothetical protein